MRLDRCLADCGIGTRSALKEMIKRGLVTVEGLIERDPGRHVAPLEQQISVAGTPVQWKQRRVFLLNKPAGVITATTDPKWETVLDLLPETLQRMNLVPVGRLDRDTEGLLLLTNDGTLAHALLAPKRHVDKEYEAVLDQDPPKDAENLFARGVTLTDGTICRPARLSRSGEAGNDSCRVRVVVVEGKFHQVKRMFQAVGCEVQYLKRIRMGPLHLDPGMVPGDWRALTEQEMNMLNELTEPNASVGTE